MDVRSGLYRDRWLLDRTQYVPEQRAGHYESFYQRANHPDRPLAFWIRYTIFAPANDPAAAIGELWAVVFDGETGRHTVAKEEFPLADCAFDRTAFNVRIGRSELDSSALAGAAGAIRWELSYEGSEPPLLLLPPKMYAGGIPKAKSLVPLPLARFRGSLVVAGDRIEVDDWIGSQNHNWGSEHTSRYAFGQVAGFDEAPDTFLEVATVQARIAGPIRTPELTTLVLRHGGAEYSFVSIGRALRAKARYGYFHWDFATGDDSVRIAGRIAAERAAFVGLRYNNPPGGVKYCLNTKIGSVDLTVRDRRSGRTQTLRAANRALFEILTDDTEHGVPLRA
jgi:hypothetical protein